MLVGSGQENDESRPCKHIIRLMFDLSAPQPHPQQAP